MRFVDRAVGIDASRLPPEVVKTIAFFFCRLPDGTLQLLHNFLYVNAQGACMVLSIQPSIMAGILKFHTGVMKMMISQLSILSRCSNVSLLVSSNANTGL